MEQTSAPPLKDDGYPSTRPEAPVARFTAGASSRPAPVSSGHDVVRRRDHVGGGRLHKASVVTGDFAAYEAARDASNPSI